MNLKMTTPRLIGSLIAAGALGLALAPIAPSVLASAVDSDAKGVFLTPNSQSLIGVEVGLQGLRLEVGKGLKGAWAPVARVTVLP